jgi:DNA-binding transcriptional ArsR family regulator
MPRANVATSQEFMALADPTRRAILRLLKSTHISTAGEIAAAFPAVGRTAVSAHLRVLRNARLVSEVRDGKYRRYSLGPNRAAEVVAFLQDIYAESRSALRRATPESPAEAVPISD